MHKHLLLTALCALLLGLTPWGGTVHADERTANTVIVTAGRIAETPKTVTQTVTVIPAEEIKKNSSKTLTDVLRQNGIQVHVGGGYGTTATPQITLRGLRASPTNDPNSSNVMLLVDGQRIASVNPDMIPLVSVERVEILRGPAAVQYGSMAIGGVVNIITRRGREETKAYAEVGGGTWNSWQGMVGVSGMLGNLDYSIGVQHSLRNSDWTTGDGLRIHNSDYRGKTSYAAQLGYSFLEEHRISLSAMGSNFYDVGDPGSRSWTTPNAISDRENHALHASYTGSVKDYGLSWKLDYSNAKGTFYSYNPDEGIPFDYEAKHQGAQGQLTWKYDFLTLTGGIDWSEAKYRDSGNIDEKESGLTDVGGFLLAKGNFFDNRLILSAGARYDSFTQSYGSKRKHKDNMSLNAGIAVSPLDWLTLRANIGEAYRMPGGMEVVGYNSAYGKVNPNHNLEPEKGLGWDVGFDVYKNGFRAGLTYFSTAMRDKISPENVPGTFDKRYVNLPGTSHLRGFEGHASYDLGQAFDWSFILRPYVTFTHLLQKEDGQGNVLHNIRDWTAGFGINYSHPSIGLDVDLCFTYLGEQQEADTVNWGGPDLITDPALTADLTVTQTVHEWEKYGTLKVKGEARNIFNADYTPYLGYPAPGRSFYLGIIWEY